MIKLYHCAGCKRPKQKGKQVEIEKDGHTTKAFLCIECLDSAQEIIKLIKKLSQAERQKVVDFVFKNLVGYKK